MRLTCLSKSKDVRTPTGARASGPHKDLTQLLIQSASNTIPFLNVFYSHTRFFHSFYSLSLFSSYLLRLYEKEIFDYFPYKLNVENSRFFENCFHLKIFYNKYILRRNKIELKIISL